MNTWVICGVGIGLLGTAEATCESDTAARR